MEKKEEKCGKNKTQRMRRIRNKKMQLRKGASAAKAQKGGVGEGGMVGEDRPRQVGRDFVTIPGLTTGNTIA